MFMGFFNSLSVRIPLAVIGGVLYGLLTYAIVLILKFPLQAAFGAGLIIFSLYFGSRLLILFSGVDTPYYSKERKGSPYENTVFHQTAQWVGRFYHYHDVALFAFLSLVAIGFIISLIMDAIENRPFGHTIQGLWDMLMLKK
jgi:hypothetical protein